DANVSKKELCEHIRQQVPDFTFVDAPVGKDPDQRNYIVSNAKIEATGYKPSVSLDAGIAELVKGYVMIKNNQYGNAIPASSDTDGDRKSTRLNSSHVKISYAVFCLKKKKKTKQVNVIQ